MIPWLSERPYTGNIWEYPPGNVLLFVSRIVMQKPANASFSKISLTTPYK